VWGFRLAHADAWKALSHHAPGLSLSATPTVLICSALLFTNVRLSDVAFDCAEAERLD